ncbi:MAG TPA: hypothetical protein VF098_06000 [Sphingomicrobium sp.]|jgi:hypothetical protein
MSRPVPLTRLRDISKQRSIRRPLLVVVPRESNDDRSDLPDKLIEWPISG